MVNDGVVELSNPEKEKLLSVNPVHGNKSYWKMVLRCDAWKPLNRLVDYFIPWEFPKGVDTFETYVDIVSYTDPVTQLATATHVQIKPSVLESGDWTWLPRTLPG